MVNFELYWRGPYKVSEKWFSSVALNFLDRTIVGEMNRTASEHTEQRLVIGSAIWEAPNFTIACSLRMAKKIHICVATYSKVQSNGIKIEKPYPVSVNSLPEFKDGETYQIKLVHEDGKIHGIIENTFHIVKELIVKTFQELNKTEDSKEKKGLKLKILRYYKDLICLGMNEHALPTLLEDMQKAYDRIQPFLEDRQSLAMERMKTHICVNDSPFFLESADPMSNSDED